jgi:multidrug efflux pump
MKINPFIDRPVFAAVISIVFVLAGLVAMRVLPVEQYPQIVPPQVVVQATYPGASAETVAQTVAAPLEQQINGVENMLYMQSTSSSVGTMQLTVTFQIGTNPDQATINVNNRVQRAVSTLPSEVTRQGLIVNKQSSSILAVVAMSATDSRYDSVYLSNYALLNVIDELKRIPGIGDASLFGAKDYSMRIWLRPDKLAQYDLTPGDIATAIREQNAQVAAGRFGEDCRTRKRSKTLSFDRMRMLLPCGSRILPGWSWVPGTTRSQPRSTAPPLCRSASTCSLVQTRLAHLTQSRPAWPSSSEAFRKASTIQFLTIRPCS